MTKEEARQLPEDRFHFIRGEDLTDEAFCSEMHRRRKDRIRNGNWWRERGWKKEAPDVIGRVLADQKGELSGTCKLVMHTESEAAEVYFPPGGRPRVVAVYKRH